MWFVCRRNFTYARLEVATAVFLRIQVSLDLTQRFEVHSASSSNVSSPRWIPLSLTVKALRWFETSGTTHPTTQCHILEDLNPQLVSMSRSQCVYKIVCAGLVFFVVWKLPCLFHHLDLIGEGRLWYRWTNLWAVLCVYSPTLYRGMVPVLESLCASNFVYFYTFHGLKELHATSADQNAGRDLLLASVAGELSCWWWNLMRIIMNITKQVGVVVMP
jgi:hypothetical protein